MSTEAEKPDDVNIETNQHISSTPATNPCLCGSGKPRRTNIYGRLLDVCDECFDRRIRELAQKFRAGLKDPKEG